MRHALSLHLLSLIGLCALSLPAHAAIYRVGALADTGCTHHNIQDALDAAATDPATYDLIYVASNQAYTAQALSIDHQAVAIYGGYAQCADFSASGPATVLDGNGNGGLPVIDINLIGEQRVVTLGDLDLRNGNVGAGDGGNLRIRGQGQINLGGVLLHDGTATRGGGLYAIGDDASHMTNLQIGSTGFAPTTVEGNLASADGGGVYCDRYCFLGIGSIRVADNDAQRGGGIFMAGQSSMSFSAGGLVAGIETGILNNRASLDGGGLYGDTGSRPSTARYFEIYGSPRIAGNQVGRDGGGVFLTGTGTYFLAYNLYLEDNRAGVQQNGRGGGLYVGAGASTYLSEENASIRCGVTQACVAIAGNSANAIGQTGSGGGLFIDADGVASLSYALIADNSATDGAAITVRGNNAQLWLRNAVVTGNAGLHGVLTDQSGSSNLQGVTITDESSTGAMLRVSFATLDIDSSILYDLGNSVLEQDGTNTITSDCVLSHQDYDVAGDVRIGNPDFVDAANRDFRLAASSDAVDACGSGPFAPDDTDYSEALRGIDLPEIINLGGPFDLGAHERQLPPEVFMDGFESP